MTCYQHAIRQLEAIRGDTLKLLDGLLAPDWFYQPFPGANHIAWQVGHIIVAQYGLTMGEVLGRKGEESPFFSAEFRDLFKRKSIPLSSSAFYPPHSELLTMLKLTHQHVIRELERVDPSQWNEPTAFLNPNAKTKLESLFFCVRHEAIHAGQIAVLRRSLQKPPMR